MKFIKGISATGVNIPKAGLKLSGLSDTEKLELHTLNRAAVLLKPEMTAVELLAVVKSLDKLSGDLLSVLAISCEKCVGCEDECPFSQESRDIRLPKYLLEAAEIPVFDLGIWCGKMSPEPSPAESQRARTSASSSRRSAELKAILPGIHRRRGTAHQLRGPAGILHGQDHDQQGVDDGRYLCR